MSNSNRFGSLLGVIYVSHSSCKFLVYAAKNAEILTCHEVKLVELSPCPGWSEFDANVIWKSVLECIEVSIKNLLILDINPSTIIALGICNQRETTIVWDSNTGLPLYNAIAWCDTRTSDLLGGVLQRTRNKVNYLKEATGLPLSTCFSALKIRWLIENVGAVRDALEQGNLLFGTLDTWVLWNLTGGLDSGVHVTDVTNASRTQLMDISSQQWDRRLCDFFKIPRQILPSIKSSSEVYGYVNAGLLSEVPIASLMGDQQAALLGQLCIEPGSITCNYDEGCSLLFNTGQEVIDSQFGLISTVAFKLGPRADTFFALEGSAPCAGTAITWLRETLMISTTKINTSSTCVSGTLVQSMSDPVISPTGSTGSTNNNVKGGAGDVTFVPAFSGFYAPFWRANARGILGGLTQQTRPEQIVYATYEAIAFQTRQFLESLTRDCPMWPPITRLIVGGDTLTENGLLLQLIADLCGLLIEKPQTSSPACLGTMLATGLAMKIVTLDHFKNTCIPPVDVFLPSISNSQRDIRFAKWMNAVKKSLALESSPNSPNRRFSVDETDTLSIFKDRSTERPVSFSLPGSLFLFSSFTILIVAQLLQK